MKTKELIKEKARVLFNQQGVMNVTLRQVASEAGKSYGNVTYHYKNKQELLMNLYQDMHQELQDIQLQFDSNKLLQAVLEAPGSTFALSIKYAFFFSDFNELKRNFVALAHQLMKDNQARKSFYLKMLQKLQQQRYLREDLDNTHLDYIMDLSGMVRTYFFVSLTSDAFKHEELEDKYIRMVNQLLYPYLSAQGIKIYKIWQQNFSNRQ